ncbi:hypothetical protein BVRB_026200, partial [Beta vulgaris subsp. vulgaris]
PNITDVRIQAKIEHNNRIAGDGRRWYEQQAYKAVNQALGRVIRHAGDYGLLLLLDKRFASKSNRDISAWLRAHIQNFLSVDELCERTQEFFDSVEKLKPFKYVNPEPVVTDENLILYIRYEVCSRNSTLIKEGGLRQIRLLI